MAWLQRHAWQLLLALTVLVAVIGINPVIQGIREDETVTLGFTGLTAAQLEAANPQTYRLLDFQARSGGIALIAIGTLLSAILVGAYRHARRWAWWAMWILPAWGVSIFLLILAVGLEPGQPPPYPMISGPIVAALSSALLLISAPQFLGREGRPQAERSDG
jgi:hypothetical protein